MSVVGGSMGDRSKLSMFSRGRLIDLRNMLGLFEREGLTKKDIDLFFEDERRALIEAEKKLKKTGKRRQFGTLVPGARPIEEKRNCKGCRK